VRRVRGRTAGRLAGGLALVCLLAACAREEPHGVLLIGIDTLRADHLGCYGYHRPTSPRIDALAAESVLFEQAISQSPWTLPAFASIMTGVVPSRHGAGEGKRCLSHPCAALGAWPPTLADRFAEAGYRTGSFVSNGFSSAQVGLGRGFQTTELHMTGQPVVTSAAAWLAEQKGAPFFLFVHLIEPHAPYWPGPEDREPFVDPAYDGPVDPALTGRALRDWTEADRRHVVDLYDGDVRHADRLVGELLDALRRLGRYERTLIVLTSDHGEELFERGLIGHGHTLYDELLHVPLTVRFPGGAPRGRIARQVRTMDVFPTVLEGMGMPVPDGLDARSLLGVARGEPGDAALDVALAEFTFAPPERQAVRRPPEKLVLDVERDWPQLFDLTSDPEERDDRARDAPERVAALREALVRPAEEGEVGFYVMLRGGRERRRVHLRLSVPGTRLRTAALRDGEAGDVLTVGEQRDVTVELVLDPGDADTVWIDTEPVLHALQLDALLVDDQPIAPARIMLGRTPAPPSFTLPRAVPSFQLAVPSPQVPRPLLDGEVRVAVQAVREEDRPAMAIDASTREQLRALGYAE
jgi:arylsulfatase A-like enzyme